MRRFSKMSAATLATVMLVLNAGSNVYADNVSGEELLTEESENVCNGCLTIDELEQFYEDIEADETKINSYSDFREFIMRDKMNTIESYEYMLKEQTDPAVLEEIQNKLESLKSELAEYSINSIAATTNDLPNSFDLSTNSETSKYFPAIKYQGSEDKDKLGKGSCQFFAMYYYMFGYEANILNNKNSKLPENCYSPEWGYVQYFNNRKGIIDSLKNFGAVKWNDCEYYGDLGNDISLSEVDENALLEALKTRLVEYGTFELKDYDKNSIDFDDKTFIYDGKSELLNFIKESIYYKKPCYASCYITWNTMRTSSYELVITQIGMSRGAHALTIVGYDDNFWCDVNGNKEKEKGEVGALKVANSGGTDWGKNGYGWILYDALNENPKIPADKIPGRTTAFYNKIGYFNVKAYRPKLIARLEFDGWDPDKTSVSWGPYLYLNRTDKKIMKDDAIRLINRETVPLDKTVRLYDYAEYADTVDDIIGDQLFGVKVETNSEYDKKAYFSNINCSLIDSKKNIIPTSKNVNQKNSFDITKNDDVLFRTSLNLGDIDYDKKITDADAQTVLKIASGINTNPSYLQLLLADYNRDGKVDLKDAKAVNQAKQ